MLVFISNYILIFHSDDNDLYVVLQKKIKMGLHLYYNFIIVSIWPNELFMYAYELALVISLLKIDRKTFSLISILT